LAREEAPNGFLFVGFENEVMEHAEPFNLQRDHVGGLKIVQHRASGCAVSGTWMAQYRLN